MPLAVVQISSQTPTPIDESVAVWPLVLGSHSTLDEVRGHVVRVFYTSLEKIEEILLILRE